MCLHYIDIRGEKSFSASIHEHGHCIGEVGRILNNKMRRRRRRSFRRHLRFEASPPIYHFHPSSSSSFFLASTRLTPKSFHNSICKEGVFFPSPYSLPPEMLSLHSDPYTVKAIGSIFPTYTHTHTHTRERERNTTWPDNNFREGRRERWMDST